MPQAPPPEAPFADKMAYYRTQHTSKGVKAAHLLGTPIIAAGLPLVFAKPKVGATMFVGGWAMQIIGHRLFEKNLPSTHKGWVINWPASFMCAGSTAKCLPGAANARRDCGEIA
jgi:hypothetical protein